MHKHKANTYAHALRTNTHMGGRDRSFARSKHTLSLPSNRKTIRLLFCFDKLDSVVLTKIKHPKKALDCWMNESVAFVFRWVEFVWSWFWDHIRNKINQNDNDLKNIDLFIRLFGRSVHKSWATVLHVLFFRFYF